jgi:amidase
MRLFLEAVLGANPALRDPDALPIPLQVPDLTKKKLRVGIMMHDGVVMPHPPMIRALKMAKAKLEASSEVEVVDYTPYDHDRGYNIVVSLVYVVSEYFSHVFSARFTMRMEGPLSDAF